MKGENNFFININKKIKRGDTMKKTKYDFEVLEKRISKVANAKFTSTGKLVRFGLNSFAVKVVKQKNSKKKFGKFAYDKKKKAIGILLSEKEDSHTFLLQDRIYANTLINKFNAPIEINKQYDVKMDGNALVIKL